MSELRTTEGDVLVRLLDGMFVNGEPRFTLRVGFGQGSSATLTTDEVRLLREMCDQAVRYGEWNAGGRRRNREP